MISSAIISDAEDISQLVNSAYSGDSSRKGWTTEADLLDGGRTDAEALMELLRRPDTTVLLYKEGDLLLGCVELRKEANRLYLGMLSVKPDTQGKGIGKALLKASEEHARKAVCTSIFMTVISARRELIDWYARHGYTLTGERKPFTVRGLRFGVPKRELDFAVLEKKL